MSKSVEQVLIDMVEICEQMELEYAVMGGLAVRVHGIPRPTFDVDFQLTIPSAAWDRFFSLAEVAGYEISEVFRRGWRDTVGGMPLVKLKFFTEVGKPIDVDIFVNETPYQNQVIQRRQAVDFEGRELWFVSPEDLILLKLLANRPRDLGDVGDVLFIQGELDSRYLRHWAEQLGITERLEQVLSTQ
jgi:hypothetical protein